MRTWFTSDLHFGHSNIIDYCARPFGTADEMNAELIQRWNDTVSDDDTVWVLGDFALGAIEVSLAFASSLRGHKILLAGNHDRCWSGRTSRSEGSTEAWTDLYLAAGFDEVLQGEQSIAIAGQQVLLCHFPYEGDSHDQDRYLGHRPVDHGGWLLHGHVHERWRQRGRMINVGVDVNDFRPLDIDEVARMIASGPTQDVVAPKSVITL